MTIKRIFIILTLVFCCSKILFSQIDDLTIAQNLIGKYKKEIDTILKSLNLEYYKTYNSENAIVFYLARGNESIRSWTLSFEDLTKVDVDGSIMILAKDICTEVYIRYHHTNINDLRDFNNVVLPENNKIIYEKSLGKDVSHILLSRELK
jgi:hypothetical protein